MALAYIRDDGGVIGIQEAMEKEPLRVRGLIFEVIDSCRQELPDTLETLHVEIALRTAFANFPGEERLVKMYLLKRQAQRHVQTSTRGTVLMPSALKVGGPCALVSIFYATLDQHRNPEIAKVLRILEEGISPQSRDDLFRRANTFPPNPSFDRWYGKVLAKVDHDTVGLISILACLGTAEVPRIIFDRAQAPSRRWDMDGEVCLKASELDRTIQSRQSFENVMRTVESIGWATMTSDTIYVNKRLTGIVMGRSDIHQWKASTLQLLLHALPTHVGLDPENYVNLHETILPQLKHAITYLNELHVMPLLTVRSGPGLREAVELCMATSSFSDHKWKEEALSIGRDMLDIFRQVKSQPSEVLQQRFKTRQLRYAMLRTAATAFDGAQDLQFPHNDTPGANAWSADLILLQAHDYIKGNYFESASRKLSEYSPVFGSTLERFQETKVDAARGVVSRYQGLFHAARGVLSGIETPNSYTLAHLLAVDCELGEYDKASAEASAEASAWLQLCTRPRSKAAIRIRLASINAELMGGLELVASGEPWPRWKAVCAMYEDLRSYSELCWFDCLAVLLGIAMAQHAGGDLGAAENAWKEVYSGCIECQLTGYTGRVVDWSLCELGLRRGWPVEASKRLGDLSDRTKREYILLG
ncbi:hypothetical protein F4678DRAFT_451567 [Xylaria arbuscula]|nr:hypothetical protein F4678DRAFT_451567 [Xylaria arbuscula]